MKRPGRRQRMEQRAALGGEARPPSRGSQGTRDDRRRSERPTNPVRSARAEEPPAARSEPPHRGVDRRGHGRGPRPDAKGGGRPAPAPAPRATPAAEPFPLRPGSPFIELQHLLKAVGAADSGGGAKMAIQSGEVVVNGDVETRRGRKLVAGDVVGFAGRLWRVEAAG